MPEHKTQLFTIKFFIWISLASAFVWGLIQLIEYVFKTAATNM